MARDYIDKDRKWVVKVHKKTPGYYNPDHTPRTQQQTEVGNNKAGPSSAGNMHMPNKLEEALSSFGDEEDETLQMGPA